jgi:hypothetical protein
MPPTTTLQITEQISLAKNNLCVSTKEVTLRYFLKSLCNVNTNTTSSYWSQANKSLYIESLLLDLPIFRVVLDPKNSILDGRQRILCVSNFINNNFELTDLKILPDLEGFTFGNLPEPVQSKFLKSKVFIIQGNLNNYQQ